MTEKTKSTKCYIASYAYPKQDSVLKQHGISGGLICFSIPGLGIAFRCLAQGENLKMEFSTFFSLLEFIQTKLKNENIKSVEVHSSNPQFVFAFSSYSDFLKEGTTYRHLLNSYMKTFSIQIKYVKPQLNQALYSASDFPSLPVDKKIDMEMNKEEMNKIEFKPFQKGIKF